MSSGQSAIKGIIYGVIVTFRPDMGRLALLLRAVAPQVSSIVIVDNGGDAATIDRLARTLSPSACIVVANTRNVGLAAAQNAGIDVALRAGAQYVLFLDDDSVPDHNMVTRLIEEIESAAEKGDKIAAAGPVFTDERSGAFSHFIRFGLLGFKRLRCRETVRSVWTDLLISSGMVVPATVFQDVGTMDESFFIDCVDTEWCLRAASFGYRMLGVCAARMSHQLGDSFKTLAAGRRFFLHSPTRRYFMFRNSVLLYRRAYPALRWKMADAVRLLALFLLIALLSSRRLKDLGAAARGVFHGICGRTGPLPVGIEE